MLVYFAILLAAFVTFTISAISGGGAGLALMPVLALVVPATQIPAALSIGTATSALSRATVFRRDIRWDIVRWFVPAALSFTIAGVWLLSVAQPSWVQLALGVFLAANIAMIVRKPKRLASFKVGGPSLLLVGAGAGLLSGFTGAVGVVFNGFYLRCGLSKEELVATRAANETLLHVFKIGLYFAFGLLDHDAAGAGLTVAMAAILSSVVARPLLSIVSEPFFRGVNYAAMGVAGLAMVHTAGGVLAARYDVSLRGTLTLAEAAARFNIGSTAISVEWKRGSGPKIERSISVGQLPRKVREAAAAVIDEAGGGEATYEEVRGLRSVSYEVRVNGVTRSLAD